MTPENAVICIECCKELSIPGVKMGLMVYEKCLVERENIRLRINQLKTADVYVIS